MLIWKLEINHFREAIVLLPSPALRHVAGVFSSPDHGQVTLKIWDQEQPFFHRSDYWDNRVCFILVAFYTPA